MAKKKETERKKIYQAIILQCGYPSAGVSTSKKRLEEFMKKNFKGYPYKIEEVENI